MDVVGADPLYVLVQVKTESSPAQTAPVRVRPRTGGIKTQSPSPVARVLPTSAQKPTLTKTGVKAAKIKITIDLLNS